MTHDWKMGDAVHGFAAGYFGRDSYECRIVEATGPDWVVTRNNSGEIEMVSRDRIPTRQEANFRYVEEDWPCCELEP